MALSPTRTGLATTFADPSDILRYYAAIARGRSEKQALLVGDNGVGHPDLGSISTPNSFGVALPSNYLTEQLGNEPAAWRAARARLTIGGNTVMVPIVDIGPGKGPQSRGVVTDVTHPLSQALGGFDSTKANVQILPNAGPDYTTDQDRWYQEQSKIAQQLGYPGIGSEPAPTPNPMVLTPPAVRRAQPVSVPRAQPVNAPVAPDLTTGNQSATQPGASVMPPLTGSDYNAPLSDASQLGRTRELQAAMYLTSLGIQPDLSGVYG
jgi:hypothetical protein